MWEQRKVTLKQLTDRQRFTGEEDSALIAEWFEQNNMALEGIDIVSKLAKKKIENDDWKFGWLRSDLTMYSATENIMKDYGIEDGCKLNSAVTNWIICSRMGEDFKEKCPQLFDWVLKFVPQKHQPFIFWQPFKKWLNDNNIFFKDQIKEMEEGNKNGRKSNSNS